MWFPHQSPCLPGVKSVVAFFRHKNTFALPFSFTHLCLTNYAYRRGQINYHKNNIQIRIFQCTGIIIIFSIPLFIMSWKYIFCFVGNVWNSTHYIKSHKKILHIKVIFNKYIFIPNMAKKGFLAAAPMAWDFMPWCFKGKVSPKCSVFFLQMSLSFNLHVLCDRLSCCRILLLKIPLMKCGLAAFNVSQEAA